MFVGHYAAGLALKSVDNRVSLGWLFLGVQFVDILFFPFALLGIERFQFIPHYTASTHFFLEYMPYTHSLLSAFVWAGLTFAAAWVLWSGQGHKRRMAAVVALAVLSHWFLDLLVHTPDLPLLGDDSLKLGFGLWNNAPLTYGLEALLLLGGLYFYMKSTRGETGVAKYGMPAFVVLMLGANIINIFGPVSPDETAAGIAFSALTAYFVFAALAFYLDSRRSPR